MRLALTRIESLIVTALLMPLVSGSCLAGDAHEDVDLVQVGGFKALMPASSNTTLTAFLRKVRLSSGEQWAIDLYGDHLVGFQMDQQSVPESLPENSAINLSIHDASAILASAVNQDGMGQAAASHMDGATVVLDPPIMMTRQNVSAAVKAHPHLSVLLKAFEIRMAKQRKPLLPITIAAPKLP